MIQVVPAAFEVSERRHYLATANGEWIVLLVNGSHAYLQFRCSDRIAQWYRANT